jgi:hypothetical protein
MRVMNHLMNRRQGRRPPPSPGPTPWPPSGLAVVGSVQDCYLNWRAVDVVDASAGPNVVSRITTGYSGRSPGPASDVLIASGRTEPPGVYQP